LRINWPWNIIYKTIGSGMDWIQIYPKTHKAMLPKQKRMRFYDRVLSSKSRTRNFVRRNRIVAGMSEATVVIQELIGVDHWLRQTCTTITTEMFCCPEVAQPTRAAPGCKQTL
jgi:hypothetical protein